MWHHWRLHVAYAVAVGSVVAALVVAVCVDELLCCRGRRRRRVRAPDPTGAEPPTRRRPRTRQAADSFAVYIFKILKQVHPNLGISTHGMGVADALVQDVLADMMRRLPGGRVDVDDVEAVVTQLLPGELARHAVAEGRKAVAKYEMNGGVDEETEEEEQQQEEEHGEEGLRRRR